MDNKSEVILDKRDNHMKQSMPKALHTIKIYTKQAVKMIRDYVPYKILLK